jgi:hypothetical protein
MTISPGRRVMIRRWEWSTSTMTSWPRQEIVFGEGVAMGDLIELVAAGDVLHCPFASIASVKAAHAVTTSGSLTPQ